MELDFFGAVERERVDGVVELPLGTLARWTIFLDHGSEVPVLYEVGGPESEKESKVPHEAVRAEAHFCSVTQTIEAL